MFFKLAAEVKPCKESDKGSSDDVWCVYAESGKLLGKYKLKSEAIERLEQIQRFVHLEEVYVEKCKKKDKQASEDVWCVYTRKGKCLGSYPTKAKAEARRQSILKAKREKSKKKGSLTMEEKRELREKVKQIVASLRVAATVRKCKEEDKRNASDVWCVYSESTGRLLGRYRTKEEAEERLRQVEYWKKVKGSLEEPKQAGWEKLPRGWTEESLKSFWESLTGDVVHKVTKCIKRMQGKVDNPGAFCASLADRIEGKEWRSRRRKKSSSIEVQAAIPGFSSDERGVLEDVVRKAFEAFLPTEREVVPLDAIYEDEPFILVKRFGDRIDIFAVVPFDYFKPEYSSDFDEIRRNILRKHFSLSEEEISKLLADENYHGPYYVEYSFVDVSDFLSDVEQGCRILRFEGILCADVLDALSDAVENRNYDGLVRYVLHFCSGYIASYDAPSTYLALTIEEAEDLAKRL